MWGAIGIVFDTGIIQVLKHRILTANDFSLLGRHPYEWRISLRKKSSSFFGMPLEHMDLRQSSLRTFFNGSCLLITSSRYSLASSSCPSSNPCDRHVPQLYGSDQMVWVITCSTLMRCLKDGSVMVPLIFLARFVWNSNDLNVKQ